MRSMTHNLFDALILLRKSASMSHTSMEARTHTLIHVYSEENKNIFFSIFKRFEEIEDLKKNWRLEDIRNWLLKYFFIGRPCNVWGKIRSFFFVFFYSNELLILDLFVFLNFIFQAQKSMFLNIVQYFKVFYSNEYKRHMAHHHHDFRKVA